MIEPKEFYRKLDSLLSKIGQEKTGQDFLFTIVKELENTFGKDLKIGNGYIYEKNGEQFTLISSPPEMGRSKIALELPIVSDAVQLILQSKTYIFDNPIVSIDSNIGSSKEYSIPAAITVHSQDNRWIFIFELKSGWIREEIEFCLNAVRTNLNHRLFSESVKSELEQAVQIQQSLLPTSSPEIPGYQIAGFSRPAELVGGDLYDYFQFDGEEFGFCIGDASGHGIPAALMARDVVIGLRMGLEKHMKMVHSLKKLNSVIYRSVYSTKFISLFYAEMETDGNLFYVNAGHPAPILLHGDEIIELESTNIVFGALPQIELRRSYAHINPNSVLVLFSDGILERENSQGEEFGEERLKQLIKDNKDKTANELLDLIFLTADEFGKGKNWDDDATVVVIKRE